MLFTLFYGVFTESGTSFIYMLLLYFLTFVVCYFFISSFLKNRLKFKVKKFNNHKYKNSNFKDILIFSLCSLLFITVISHYIDIGFVPVIKAYFSSDYYEVVDIRKQGSYLSTRPVRYLSSFMIKSIIPFLLFYLLISRRYILFSVIFTLGIFYAFSLMQKSFIITILFPCFTYAILKRHYLMSITFTLTLFSYMFCLLNITNPQLKPKDRVIAKTEIIKENSENDKKDPQIKKELSLKEIENKFKEQETNKSITGKNKKTTNNLPTFVNSLIKRVLITPGKIVSKWFENIPSNQPFLGGCGYRFIAPIIGCKYQNYSQELYKNIFPKYAAKGIKGNVNTTSFMYEYSNFGVAGLIFSALVMGLIIAFIDYLFAFSLLCKFSINGFYVLMLSSSALTTLMFSGGWALMIILFYIYKSEFLKLH